MAADKVKVEGARQLRESLKRAGGDLADLKAANASVAELVASAGRSRAPVGETGALASSIRSSGTKSAAVIRAGGPSVPYAGVQEFGWPAANIPASPYLTAALEDLEGEIVDLYYAEIDRILAKVEGAPGFGR